MSTARIIVLDDHRPAVPARDLLRVAAIVGGALMVAVTDGDGEVVELVLSRREMREHIMRCQDAMDLAEGLR